MQEPKPFVKWAGGKTRLLQDLLADVPLKFENYFEPFVGGGALFFKLCSLGRIKKAFLNDSNKDLMTAYEVIKTKPYELIKELASPNYKNSEETYYEIRAKEPTNKVQQAARFIYLNKTAYNGLYRVNSQGKFNVPFGKYENPKILDMENILSVSKALQTDELTCIDFEQAVEKAKEKDFVYLDPPYHPISKTSSFTSYTRENFTEKDQKRLFKCFQLLDEKGCFVMLSNSCAPLIEELYKDYNISVVMAGRAISCKGEGRGKINEFLITNYKVHAPLKLALATTA